MAFPPRTGYNFATTTHNDTYPAIDVAKSNQKGRRVFITGASKGIGRATAIAFAQAGASIIAIGARSPLDAVEHAILEAARVSGHSAPRILKLDLDVSDERSVADAASKAEEVFGGDLGSGGLDILINNAGRMEHWAPLGDSDPGSWWATWEVTVKGTYLVTRALLPLLLKSSEKTIINIGSLGAFMIRPTASAYQTSKLAMLRLAEVFCADYTAEGLLAYTLNPGAVPTEMVMETIPKDSHFRLTDTVELPAHTIVWLTQARREWLAGRYLSANWDMPEIFSRREEIVQGDKLKVKLVL